MSLRILLAALLLPASALADAGREAAECEPDAALSAAAGELLLLGGVPKDDALIAAVRAAGSDLVGVRALYAPSRVRAPREQFLQNAAARADAPLVCGAAQSEHGRLWLVAARAGRLELVPGEEPIVRGDLAAGFAKPELVIEDGTGDLSRVALSAEELRKGFVLSPDVPRPLRVQLVAVGKLGPRPIAERALAEEAVATSRSHAAAPDLEPRAQLDLARAEARRSALRSHALLARVATNHASDVCARGRVAHALDPGRDPKARLREAGVGARRVGEAVARDLGDSQAFARMLESPSHRATLLEPGFTDVGLGRATDPQGRTCLVVLLAAWPRYLGK